MPSSGSSVNSLDPQQLELCAIVISLVCRSCAHDPNGSRDAKIIQDLASRVWQSITEGYVASQTIGRYATATAMIQSNSKAEYLSEREHAARVLARRIRKLRWLGLWEEARSLEAILAEVPAGESVLLLPINTD
jgi:hypothetical protein